MCETLYTCTCFHAGKKSQKVIMKYARDVASRSPDAKNRINAAIGDIKIKCRKLSDLRKQGKVSVL